MTFDLEIPRLNVQMDVRTTAIQKHAKSFVIVFIHRANHFTSA